MDGGSADGGWKRGVQAAGGSRSRVARETGGRRSAREARSPQLPPLMSPHTNYLLILSPFCARFRVGENKRDGEEKGERERETSQRERYKRCRDKRGESSERVERGENLQQLR